MQELEDEICQTLADEVSEKFCRCGHLIEKHFVGELTKITKCFSLINNGSVISACNCDKLSPIDFKIEITF